MHSFMRFILRQVVLVNVLFVLLMAVGLFSLSDLPVERYPNVQMGKVQITAILPGASPEDMEALVTREIEDALDDLKDVEFIQSTSYRERSVVVVKFIDDTDYDALYDELRLKVLSVLNELPRNIDPPDFMKIDVSEWLPAVNVNLVGDRSNRALSLMAEEMKILLRQIPGVREVELSGEYVREFHVGLDPELLEVYGLTLDDVANALSGANVTIPAGDFTNGSGEFVIVVDEKYRSREQVADTIVRRDADGSFVTVGDLASYTRLDYRDPYVITSINGRDCVTLKIIKSEEGNALDIVPAVQEVVKRFHSSLDEEGVQVVLSQDQRIQIDDSISTLGYNLLVGISLVFVLIFLFMGLRNALLTVVGIPFAFLVTMIFMWVTNSSLNEITLFAFVLVSGIIVDDAIVVVENIYRHLQEGNPLRQAVVNGASEVAVPVIAATSTTVAAFLPMLIMSGSTGEFFAQIPVAVSAAIMASLVECLIFLPPHFMDWPGARKAVADARGRHSAENERWFMKKLQAATLALFRFTHRLRFLSLAGVFVAFLAAIFILGVSVTGKMQLIRIKFFPDEYNVYYVDIEGPVTTSIADTSDRLKEIAIFLNQAGPGEITSATSQAGFYLNEDYQPVFGSNLGQIAVELPRKEDRRFPGGNNNDPMAYLEHVRGKLAPYEGNGWDIRVRAEPGGPPAGKSVNIRIVGPNPLSVTRLTGQVQAFLTENQEIAPYLIDLDDDQGKPSRIFRFRVKKERAAEYGLTPSQVAYLAGSVLDGRFVGEYRTFDEDIDIRLKVDNAFLDSPEDALDIPLISHPAGPVRLGELVSVESYMEPNKLSRYQNNRAVTISANIATGAPISPPLVVNRVRHLYESIKADYAGAEIDFSGEFESTQRSYISLTYAFIVAVLFIYLILATQFRSYLQPLIILSAVVFSLIGVIFGKVVTQGLFTVNSFVATVGVTGVVVNDSLVLLDFINRRYREGLSRREAMQEGIRVRLRPILLTTMTTTLGLAPMALGIPSYSLVWGSMASTFVTGLATATFLTLFIVPIQWDLLMGLKIWFYRRFRGRDIEAERFEEES